MTLVGTSFIVRGDISSGTDLSIAGHVKGDISVTEGTLTVSVSGQVVGDMRASRLVIQGRVVGHIIGEQRIELDDTAIVSGSLSAPTIVIREGAQFTGRIDQGIKSIRAAVAHHRATQFSSTSGT